MRGGQGTESPDDAWEGAVGWERAAAPMIASPLRLALAKRLARSVAFAGLDAASDC
jgi:hypothetical protein